MPWHNADAWTGLKEGTITVSCDQTDGKIRFGPSRQIASGNSGGLSAAVDMKGAVDSKDESGRRGSVSVDLAVAYQSGLSTEASAFGIKVTSVDGGIDDKKGATVNYVCECKN